MSTLPKTLRKYKQQLTESPTKQQLWTIVQDYIRYYSAEGIKEEPWMLTIGVLSSDHMEEVEKGHNRIFFYEHSLLFIDAVNQLYQQKQKKENRKQKNNNKVQPPSGLC